MSASPSGPDRAPIRDVRPLAVVAAAVTVSAAAGVLPVWPGTLHHLALPPLDLFADVRVLAARSPSYAWFVTGLALVLAARVIVLAAMLRALDRAGMVRALRFYAPALPVALVAAGFAYSGVAAVYSNFVWIGAVVALGTAATVAWRPWRSGGPLAGTSRVVAYEAGLLALSLLSVLGGPAVRVGLVWGSAALTAAAVWWIGGRTAPTGRRSLVPVLAGSSVVLAVVTFAVFASGDGDSARAIPPRRGTLFVVPGIGAASGTSSMFGFDPGTLGYDCASTVYFSYAGPGNGAPQRASRCPIRSGAPYTSSDTMQPLDVLAGRFRAQYEPLEDPVVVVAHSQGGWVAAAALAEDHVDPPDALVLLGSFPGHRGAYRLDGRGAGVVGTDMLEVLMATLRATTGTTFDPAAPLPREVLGAPDAVARLLRRAVGAGIPLVAVTSMFDLPVMVDDRDVAGVTELCPLPVLHSDLPDHPRVYEQLRRALHDPGAPDCAWWDRWPTSAFATFAVPKA